MSKPSRVVVLAEDERHQRFVRYYLYRIGHTRHDLRFEPLPSGRGCGEQWVRERYAAAVRAYRGRRAKTALIVAMDADVGDVDRRLVQLRSALSQAGWDARADGEAIAHLIPRRSIETWILCLTGSQVDEVTDYSREAVDGQIAAAALTFFNGSRDNAVRPAHWVASLLSAIPEIRRLE